MKFITQSIADVVLIVPDLHQDERGVFRRSYCQDELLEYGINFNVSQGNISENFHKHTLRGFHYQSSPSNESKIITCVSGALYNVVLDVRKKSKTYKQWAAIEINAINRESIFVPAGCANAFLTMSENTTVHYYMNDRFSPDTYCGIRYNDPEFDVKWPVNPIVISEKDKNLPDFIDG